MCKDLSHFDFKIKVKKDFVTEFAMKALGIVEVQVQSFVTSTPRGLTINLRILRYRAGRVWILNRLWSVLFIYLILLSPEIRAKFHQFTPSSLYYRGAASELQGSVQIQQDSNWNIRILQTPYMNVGCFARVFVCFRSERTKSIFKVIR